MNKKEDKELKDFMDINKNIKEISDLIIQKIHIIHNYQNCDIKEIQNWLSIRISTLISKTTDKIKNYNNNIYIKTRRK